MKKFSQILENINNQKYFEISAEIKLVVSAENEGESGYLADSILGGVEEQADFTIQNIVEISKEDYQKHFEAYGIGFDSEDIEETDEEKILKTWQAEFGDKTPTTTEKMEFYHQMRNAGFDGFVIMNTLDRKISPTWMKKQNEF